MQSARHWLLISLDFARSECTGKSANMPSDKSTRGFAPTPQQLGHMAMLLFSALVAGSFALGGMTANLIEPLALNAIRFAIAAAVIGTLAAFGSGIKRTQFQAPWRFVILGGLFAIYFALMFEGLKTASPVSTAAVFTLTPIMSAGFGWLLMRQITTPRMAFALALAGAGAIWVIFGADFDAILAFRIGRGEAIFFVGCIAHALYTPMVPKLSRGEPVLAFTFGMLIAGLCILTIFGLPGILRTTWTALPGIVWITILYLSVFASAVTFFLVQFAAMRLPSAKVMAYTYLVPTWVILWEGGLGHGWPPITLLAGVVLVIIGLILLLKE